MRCFNKRRHPATPLAFLTAATLAAACGGNGAAPDGGSPDLGTDAALASCDPAAQNCASGFECDFGCDSTTATVACRPDNGTAAIGASCSTNITPCGKGSGCIARPGFGAMCLKYCAGDGDCATGERCHNDNVGVACGAPATTLVLHYCY